jgi:phospholipase C
MEDEHQTIGGREMMPASHRRTWRERVLVGALCASLTSFATPAPAQTPNNAVNSNSHTADTPIQHVIVLIGENRTFDHLFATYVPKSGEPVKNLLSEGIINADGTPGSNFKKARQFQAVAPFKTKYYVHLDRDDKAPYAILPEPTLNFSPSPATGEPPPFPTATPLALLVAI